jgi:hypothetical protein
MVIEEKDLEIERFKKEIREYHVPCTPKGWSTKESYWN